jgi:hypothetical protein
MVICRKREMGVEYGGGVAEGFQPLVRCRGRGDVESCRVFAATGVGNGASLLRLPPPPGGRSERWEEEMGLFVWVLGDCGERWEGEWFYIKEGCNT